MKFVRTLSAGLSSVLLALVATQPVLRAQYQKFEGKEIESVRFDPAAQPLDSAELSEIVPLKARAPLRIADVRAAIERLFATGRYADIQVDAKPSDGGVALTFLTRNSWFIGDVMVTGRVSSPPNAGQLENAARLELGAPYTDALLDSALAAQRTLLESNGLYGAKIGSAPDFDAGRAYQQVNLRFTVESGRRASFSAPELVGDLKMDPAKVLAAAKLRRWVIHTWKPVTQTRIRQSLDGIRSLYQKENRLEAKISLESIRYDAAANRVVPTLRIDAGPRIELNPIGTKISRTKMQRYLPVFEEHSLDRDLLTEGARNLTGYFQSRGYFDARVQFNEQRVVNDKASIDFLIDTGPRHKLVHIGIAGNRYFPVDTIRERMLLRTASFLQFPHGRYSEGLISQDESSIVSLYQANGFRDARVTHRLEDPYQGKEGDMAVFLDIDEGPQYFIESLQVDGIESLDKTDLLSMLSSVAGQPFSEFNVAVDRDAILARYFEKGFPNATVTWSSKPAAHRHRMDLRYAISEGQAQLVRQAIATGLVTTRPSLIRRYLTLNPGDPISPAAITDIQRKLYDLGVFAKVDAAIQDPDGDTSRKYVLYNVEEARRYSAAAGFGAQLGKIGGCNTCLDAPAGVTGFSPRVSLDLTRSNLWGVAHSISLRTRASTIDQRAILNYSWPRFERDDNLNLSFTAMYEHSLDILTFNSRREEVSAQLSQRFSKTLTLFYRYSYRLVNVSDLKVTEFLIGQLSQPVRVGMPSLNLVQDRRDDPAEPHKGIYNTLDLGIAEHMFGSQRNYSRVLARNSSYYPLGKRLVLARSTEFGYLHAFSYQCDPSAETSCALNAIPLAERFFGGGGTSQRGFADNQAGPRDTGSGFPLGGTALLFNQTELRFPLIGEDIGGVLFHDLGNVYSSLGNISFRTNQHGLQDFDYMVHAVGFGIRYRTPIGPVRADFAYSINPPYFYGFKGTQQELLNAGLNPCPPNVPNQCQVQNSGHFQFFISVGQTF